MLRGIGATLSLPLLEAMVPALTAAPTPITRFGAIFTPLGQRPGYWEPKTVGKDFEFNAIMKPAEPFRDHLTVVTELCDPLDGHATTVSAWLSGQIPFRTIAENVKSGITVDQVIANKIGQDTPLPSLELATEDFTGWIGGCDTAYSCAYMNTITWKNETTPLPMEINPRVVFDRMFGGGATREERLERMKIDQSVLDLVKEDLADLQGGLGASDRSRLGEYLTHVREVERRIQITETRADAQLAIPAAPVGVPESFEEHAALLYDLMALAFEADLTRVFTFMTAREVSQRTYPQIGITEPHHSISHHGNKPDKIAGHAKINNYHVQLFARFLERLRTTPDGDGSLLDHSLIVYGSGMSNGNGHTPSPLPFVMVGGLNGQIKGNRHLVLPDLTPSANAMLTIGRKFGLEADTFGVSNGLVDL
jgi:hypothetical protein